MLAQTAWLFTRGPESVRIVRVVARPGVLHLVVHGPGAETETREFTDPVACATFQAELERRLVYQGFTLEQFTSDRRDLTNGGRPASERRRLPQLFL